MNDAPRQRERPDSASGQDPGQLLSALEAALREALAAVPRDRVAKCIAAGLPAEVRIGENTRLHGGRVRKVSVSMPEELAAAVRTRTGSGGFSRYVTEAVDREITRDLLGDLLGELEAEYGPVDTKLVEQARRQWPDYEEN